MTLEPYNPMDGHTLSLSVVYAVDTHRPEIAHAQVTQHIIDAVHEHQELSPNITSVEMEHFSPEHGEVPFIVVSIIMKKDELEDINEEQLIDEHTDKEEVERYLEKNVFTQSNRVTIV